MGVALVLLAIVAVLVAQLRLGAGAVLHALTVRLDGDLGRIHAKGLGQNDRMGLVVFARLAATHGKTFGARCGDVHFVLRAGGRAFAGNALLDAAAGRITGHGGGRCTCRRAGRWRRRAGCRGRAGPSPAAVTFWLRFAAQSDEEQRRKRTAQPQLAAARRLDVTGTHENSPGSPMTEPPVAMDNTFKWLRKVRSRAGFALPSKSIGTCPRM